MDDNLRAKASPIRLLLLDVDGVLTDGTFERRGDDEVKRFHSRDGIGIKLAQRAGIALGLVSGRRSGAVERRAEELGMSFVRLGVSDKREALAEALAELPCTPEETAFMGDDLPDLPVLLRVGLSATVADAPLEVRSRVDYVTRARGGYGAVREFVEQILLAQGKLDALVASYLE